MESTFDENDIFINQFIIESEEHILLIESSLLALEKSIESYDQEIINTLFRSIHTIKGLSGMLDFQNLFEFSHSWETLLERVRKKKQDLNLSVINLSFEALDLLSNIIDAIKRTKKDTSVEISKVTKKLNFMIDDESNYDYEEEVKVILPSDRVSPIFQKSISDFDRQKLEEEVSIGKSIYEIKMFLNQECFDKDLSYFSMCINLEMIGEIINISPNVNYIPDIQDFDPEVFDLEINILFTTEEDVNRIHTALKNKEIRVEKIFPVELKNESEKDDEENLDFNEPEKDDDHIVFSKKDTVIEQKVKNLNATDTIRVDTSKLDKLLTLIGEQVISKTQLERISLILNNIATNTEDVIDKNYLFEITANLTEKISTFSRLNNELQETIMRIRMLPIGNVFNRFTRVVRDLTRDLGKKVDLIIEGEDTELDKTIIEEISDPLVHIIRNAIDHGIEYPIDRINIGKDEIGILHLKAEQQGNSIIITIKDDGRGLNSQQIREKAIEKGLINPDDKLTKNEIINLIFEPGFTTTSEVTGISGRGVGMDVVRKNIAKLKGTIEIETKEGEGTLFVIKLPLTLAIIQSLIINIADTNFAIPMSTVVESYRARPDEIIIINGSPTLKLRENILPVLYFEDYFKLDKTLSDKNSKYIYIVVIAAADQKAAFVVNSLVGQHEVVIKPLNDAFVSVKGISGSAILGEEVILIIDPVAILINSKSIKKFEKAGILQ